MGKPSIRNLTRRFDFETDNFLAVWEEMHDHAPRAAAIVAATFLEDALRWSIEGCLTDDLPQEHLQDVFERDGAPLSSFHAKIVMGFTLGIYGAKTRNDLSVIKRIRNAFAHAPRSITFGSVEIVCECDRLCYLKSIAEQNNTSIVARDVKDMFLDTIKIIILDLHGTAIPDG